MLSEKCFIEHEDLIKMKQNNSSIEDISAQRKILQQNLNDAAIISEKAMTLAIMNFAFPVRLLMTYVYSKKTLSEFSFKVEDIFDILISILVSIWLGVFIMFAHREPENPLVAITTH